MILEQLMEKKDLFIYIDLRINQLKDVRKKAVEVTKEKRKAIIYERFSGRIRELIDLKELIKSNQIKDKSKYLWKKYNNIPL